MEQKKGLKEQLYTSGNISAHPLLNGITTSLQKWHANHCTDSEEDDGSGNKTTQQNTNISRSNKANVVHIMTDKYKSFKVLESSLGDKFLSILIFLQVG